MSSGMACPACGHQKSAVVDSRYRKDDGGSVYRRRRCYACRHRYSTRETAITDDLDEVEPIGSMPAMVAKLLRLATNMQISLTQTALEPTPAPEPSKRIRAAPRKAATPILPSSKPKLWCDQCEMNVSATEAQGCKSRFCTAKG